jgi:hypothetical protein
LKPSRGQKRSLKKRSIGSKKTLMKRQSTTQKAPTDPIRFLALEHFLIINLHE